MSRHNHVNDKRRSNHSVGVPINLSAEAVAALPPPGLTGPSSIAFISSSSSSLQSSSSSSDTYLTFLSSSRRQDRQFCVCSSSHNWRDVRPLLLSQPPHIHSSTGLQEESLEEKLRRERQRLHGGSITQFSWTETTTTTPSSKSASTLATNHKSNDNWRLLIPVRGSLYIQNGIQPRTTPTPPPSSPTPTSQHPKFYCIYDKTTLGAAAIDAQLSPDGRWVAFVVNGDIYMVSAEQKHHHQLHYHPSSKHNIRRITFGANHPQNGAASTTDTCITHGLADFVAQEEMDRYRGFWWSPDSRGILFARVDESHVPPYRITHQSTTTTGANGGIVNGEMGADTCSYEDHRYPFAGKLNPNVQLGYVKIAVDNYSASNMHQQHTPSSSPSLEETLFAQTTWFPAPREAQEYLARVSWFPDGSACAQWQNRTQTTLVLAKLDIKAGKSRTLLVERSDVWINLHHMLEILPRAIHPAECADAVEKLPANQALPKGSFSFLFASERTGYSHLYLYTYAPSLNNERAFLIRPISGGDWMVESIVGVDMAANAVYVTGTYDSALERHLYALPMLNNQPESMVQIRNRVTTGTVGNGEFSGANHHHDSSATMDTGGSTGVRRSIKNVMNVFTGKPGSRFTSPREDTTNSGSSSGNHHSEFPSPVRLTVDRGMHNVVMDDACRMFVDTSSDLGRPTSVRIYHLPEGGPFSLISKGHKMSRSGEGVKLLHTLYDAADEDKSLQEGQLLTPPELLSFPTTDGTETLHAALYRPDPRVHGPGPYPLICAVYGGPHVQRVNRSWSQCCDMRAQRMRSLGFAVIKCDNRGSSRRGLAFEGAIQQRLGRLEVLDQVTTVRYLSLRGIADATRVGIYGWSYGGYLSAMCLCRAPDVFHVAVAGAPVTSWDGYDTHYTERYMGLPSENPNGYRESSVLDHVPNMRGKLMMVHGLIDENVHFRHTARLINRLISAGKDYDLLIFPDERHSPRKLRDRIYMEQRISDYFLTHLMGRSGGGGHVVMRPKIAGHL